MEELADRIRPGRFKLVDDAANPLVGFLIFLAVRENVADAGDWPVEESCFVPGIELEDALALAEDYGQNAIVCGGADGVPRLAWVEDQPE